MFSALTPFAGRLPQNKNNNLPHLNTTQARSIQQNSKILTHDKVSLGGQSVYFGGGPESSTVESMPLEKESYHDRVLTILNDPNIPADQKTNKFIEQQTGLNKRQVTRTIYYLRQKKLWDAPKTLRNRVIEILKDNTIAKKDKTPEAIAKRLKPEYSPRLRFKVAKCITDFSKKSEGGESSGNEYDSLKSPGGYRKPDGEWQYEKSEKSEGGESSGNEYDSTKPPGGYRDPKTNKWLYDTRIVGWNVKKFHGELCSMATYENLSD